MAEDYFGTRLEIPGASLLELEATPDGVRVRCPGCSAEQVVAPGAAVQVFPHADRGCAVLRAIAAAFEAFEHATEQVG